MAMFVDVPTVVVFPHTERRDITNTSLSVQDPAVLALAHLGPRRRPGQGHQTSVFHVSEKCMTQSQGGPTCC
jgi:hypothetical protein